MNILLLNDSYFLPSLLRLGYRVFFAGASPEADFRLAENPVAVPDVLEICPFDPDVLIFSDSINARLAFLGLERLDIPLVFYGIDSPMNSFWQSDFSLACDLAFLDQKGPVEMLRTTSPAAADRINWLPLAADERIYRKLPLPRVFDVSFVGTVNSRLRPKRTWILKEIGRHFHLEVFDGQNRRALSPAQVVEIYNQSRLVINENLFPGLNLRLFEVMACGTCLLTEEGDRSWQTHFEDRRHLVSFNSENLIARIADLLENEEKRESIALRGMERVRQEHTIDNRARMLMDRVSELVQSQSRIPVASREYHLGKTYLALAQRWPQQPVGKLGGEGKRLLEEISVAKAESADRHLELALLALCEKRPGDAKICLESALRLNPNHLRSLWAMFWCLRELDEYQEAIARINQLRRILGVSRPSRSFDETVLASGELTAHEYAHLGEILEAAGWDFEGGIERSGQHPGRWNAFDAYQQAIALDPSRCEPYLKCADLMQRLNCPEFALPFVQKAVALCPLDIDLRLRFARLLMTCYRRSEGVHQMADSQARSAQREEPKLETSAMATI